MSWDCARTSCTAYWTTTSWVTSPLGSIYPAKPGGAVASVSRSSSSIDVLFVGTNGGIYDYAWRGQTAGWTMSLASQTGIASAGANLGLTARTPNNLDVFVRNSSGQTWTGWKYTGYPWGFGVIEQSTP